MREIKFRAWDKEKKEMGSVVQMTIQSSGERFLVPSQPEPGRLEVGSLFEVMQYTGLKDKNGKEIYEGDVTNYGVVRWCQSLTWDCGGSPHPGFYFEEGELNYADGFHDDIEVIGNIYENPELL